MSGVVGRVRSLSSRGEDSPSLRLKHGSSSQEGSPQSGGSSKRLKHSVSKDESTSSSKVSDSTLLSEGSVFVVSVYLYIYVSIFVCVCVCVSVCLSIYLSVSLQVFNEIDIDNFIFGVVVHLDHS